MSRKKRQLASDSIGFPTLSLPELDSFSDDEKLMAQVTIGIVRGGGAMYTGRYIECIVARLLGARFPLLGISPWDLFLDGTRIEVRSGAKSFSLKGDKDVHLWVFVHKRSPDPPLFSVATAHDVAALRVGCISAARLGELFPPVGASELAATVAAVCGRAS